MINQLLEEVGKNEGVQSAVKQLKIKNAKATAEKAKDDAIAKAISKTQVPTEAKSTSKKIVNSRSK